MGELTSIPITYEVSSVSRSGTDMARTDTVPGEVFSSRTIGLMDSCLSVVQVPGYLLYPLGKVVLP